MFTEEPLPADSPLGSVENAIVSPHVAGLSPHDDDDVTTLVAENLRRYRDKLAEQIRIPAYDLARGDVYMKAGITGLMKAFRQCELLGMRSEIHTTALHGSKSPTSTAISPPAMGGIRRSYPSG